MRLQTRLQGRAPPLFPERSQRAGPGRRPPAAGAEGKGDHRVAGGGASGPGPSAPSLQQAGGRGGLPSLPGGPCTQRPRLLCRRRRQAQRQGLATAACSFSRGRARRSAAPPLRKAPARALRRAACLHRCRSAVPRRCRPPPPSQPRRRHSDPPPRRPPIGRQRSKGPLGRRSTCPPSAASHQGSSRACLVVGPKRYSPLQLWQAQLPQPTGLCCTQGSGNRKMQASELSPACWSSSSPLLEISFPNAAPELSHFGDEANQSVI
mmetsp:Transcript_14158/g.33456  ORF Transcript_14158/g.33456 Transcript_14158/m.33456 type:complete len:264 (-) Transcript_14158:437-1228(-)